MKFPPYWLMIDEASDFHPDLSLFSAEVIFHLNFTLP